MKKLIAKRRLRRQCDFCKRTIFKNEVYYKKRTVFVVDEAFVTNGVLGSFKKVYAHSEIYCPKCKYKIQQMKLRFAKFKENCPHPKILIEEVWTNIPGEAVMEPSHLECKLCGKHV